jgi:hypothetical protein
MNPIFGDFDFEVLKDPDFREDSVREEIVVRLLSALGYSPSPPHRIIRSRRLIHPFVYIGTRKQHVTIIPDYLLQRDGQNAWILDAKAPTELITSGKHVEQAYSYAIHKEIRVPLYALCNGHRLVVYHVSHWPALIDIALNEIEKYWYQLIDLLGTKASWPNGIPPRFRPDFGLAVLKAGLSHVQGKKVKHLFLSVQVMTVAMVEEGLYTLNAICGTPEEGEFLATFDFPVSVYNQLLSALTQETADLIRCALRRQPFHYYFPEHERFTIGLVAEIGDTIHTNEDENYCPFFASQFIGPEGVA